jgi:hypothetical protein
MGLSSPSGFVKRTAGVTVMLWRDELWKERRRQQYYEMATGRSEGSGRKAQPQSLGASEDRRRRSEQLPDTINFMLVGHGKFRIA